MSASPLDEGDAIGPEKWEAFKRLSEIEVYEKTRAFGMFSGALTKAQIARTVRSLERRYFGRRHHRRIVMIALNHDKAFRARRRRRNVKRSA